MPGERLETVVILCGGRGTRLQERTHALPKPLVEIGGRPIVGHVIDLYVRRGYRRVFLCAGYLGDQLAAFVRAEHWPEGVSIECVDTGEATPTGGRVHRVRDRLGERTFALTYADGLADIDLAALDGHHAAHGGLATVTVVRPELPFGVALLDGGDRVAGFREKPRTEHWVNGGFLVLDPGVFDYLSDASVLEREPLEGLAADGQLHAYRHTGFWACMDTYKDAVALDDLWSRGVAPWSDGQP
jgi:glucose-1-phosphate cytidylyltransferase